MDWLDIFDKCLPYVITIVGGTGIGWLIKSLSVTRTLWKFFYKKDNAWLQVVGVKHGKLLSSYGRKKLGKHTWEPLEDAGLQGTIHYLKGLQKGASLDDKT